MNNKQLKLFVKVFTSDNSAKSLLADDRMTVSVICRQLADKNQIVMDPKCSIVEHIPELYLERFYEDNESLVENVLLWTRDSTNRLYFMEREDKYDLFACPERYLLGADSSERNAQLDDEARNTLVDEFFSSGRVPVPEVEGSLYLKSDGKKCWKKHFFVLRASGLYYCPKGKSKSSKDLICLTTFEMNNIYHGIGWRKKYKAPNDYGFAIKHPQIQVKNSKYIKYLCADSEQDMKLWTTGIRIAKYGRQLKDNYDNITRDIMEADLDSLANTRSLSVCSMANTIQVSPTSPTNTSGAVNGVQQTLDRAIRPTSITITSNNGHNWHRMSRNDSSRSSSTSSSSGCFSERGSNLSTSTIEPLAFETDFPIDTIKRKPNAMQPKIPLTCTTRNLALQSEDALVEMESDSSEPEDTGPHLQCGTLKSGTLRRSATDERLKTRIYEPLREQRFQSCNKMKGLSIETKQTDSMDVVDGVDSVDELPLPPPPQILQTSLSTLSLNSLPPPPEVLESHELGSDPTTPTVSAVVSPKKSPQSPQVPPKPKLLRHLSETANNRKDFMNEVKSRSNTLQRVSNTSHSKWAPEVNSAISAYATSPRMRFGPYMRAMNSTTDAINTNGVSNHCLMNGSGSSGSEPQTPVNDVLPSIPAPIHYQPFAINANQMQSQTSLSHSIYQAMPSQPVLSVQQMQPFLQQQQQHCYQQMPNQYMGQQLPQHYQQRPHVPQMQVYSNQQPIYHSNSHSGANQHVINGQTYTKSKIYSLPPSEPSARSPYKGPISSPPEEFLMEIQRVMDKKWKVAQTLSTESTATPNQILGFRDPRYLPPNSHPNNHMCHMSNIYDVLPNRSAIKSVRISSKVCEIPVIKHYNNRRPPPPPPKRSEYTHLSGLV